VTGGADGRIDYNKLLEQVQTMLAHGNAVPQTLLVATAAGPEEPLAAAPTPHPVSRSLGVLRSQKSWSQGQIHPLHYLAHRQRGSALSSCLRRGLQIARVLPVRLCRAEWSGLLGNRRTHSSSGASFLHIEIFQRSSTAMRRGYLSTFTPDGCVCRRAVSVVCGGGLPAAPAVCPRRGCRSSPVLAQSPSRHQPP
jgi:hypothetical protein